VVQLAAGQLEAHVAADGLLTVTSLKRGGRELLLAPEDLPAKYGVHGIAAGITLLHPWANRLADDDFGDAPGIARDPAGLAIHGLRQPPGAWSLRGHGAGSALATLRHAGEAGSPFPHPHRLEVAFALDPLALRVQTTLHADGGVDVPVAFGWHPYLRPPGSRFNWELALPPRRHLALDERGIPTGEGLEEAGEVALLGPRTFDDGYDGLARGATMSIGGGGVGLVVVLDDGYPAGQVFAPGDASVVSLEPMTAPTDALRTGAGLRTVPAGGTGTASFTLAVRGL
jgi:aldose 1-epimerase